MPSAEVVYVEVVNHQTKDGRRTWSRSTPSSFMKARFQLLWPQVLITKGTNDRGQHKELPIWMSTSGQEPAFIQVEVPQLNWWILRRFQLSWSMSWRNHPYPISAIPSTTTSFHAATSSTYLEWGQKNSQGLMTNGSTNKSSLQERYRLAQPLPGLTDHTRKRQVQSWLV